MWDHLLPHQVPPDFPNLTSYWCRDDTESLAMALTKRGLPCLAYHAGLKDGDRSKVQEDWMDGQVSAAWPVPD